ncbi:probable cytochrome P450 6a13 [Bicyclus anynana]|uniref:unspecific monooxygenase n=1 Tax=Bicyclus anynana TaxID=110368 RepID=A0A6J1NKI8_BICAN|nr:probable cytochrome P450 6a13 [Bicyclus anynana]
MCVTVILLVALLSLVLLLTIFHYSTKGRRYWYYKKVPYREPCPIFGNFGATLTMRQSYTKTLQFFYDKYRNEKYVGIFQARRPALLLIDVDIVKAVLSNNFSSFSDRLSVSTDTQREPLLRNLANMSGSEWQEMRRIVTPTFSSAKMKAMFSLIADCANTLKTVLLKESEDDVEVPQLMCRFTTDIIGSCAFGVDPGSLNNKQSPFLVMSQKMFKADRATILKRYCRAFCPPLFRLLNLRTYSLNVEVFFTDIINQVLTERRATGNVRSDFLQLMLNVQKSESGFPMTDELITSNSFIFMLAGLETSSTTLSFSLYQLAKDADLQSRLRAEIKECLERNNGLNYEAVCAMRLVAQTYLETLRLHPPTPLTSRLCTAPCTLPGTDLKLKAREAVIIPIHCIQKDAEHFPEPEKFDPDRFKDDLNPRGFLAFGDGPRSCPGARYAQLMVVAGLATILDNFIVEPCSRTTPTIQYDTRSVMLKNKGSIWLRFRPL